MLSIPTATIRLVLVQKQIFATVQIPFAHVTIVQVHPEVSVKIAQHHQNQSQDASVTVTAQKIVGVVGIKALDQMELSVPRLFLNARRTRCFNQLMKTIVYDRVALSLTHLVLTHQYAYPIIASTTTVQAAHRNHRTA